MKRPLPSRGFTLVEMLVVLALLSLMVLAMASALRTVGQSQERVDALLTRMDDERIATGFLRSTLGRISARRFPGVINADASPYPFAASADVLAWSGVMPARHGAGGAYFFRLAREATTAGASALVLRFAPRPLGAAAFPDWQQAESVVLADQLTALRIRCEDDTAAPATWSDGWAPTDRMPSRVAIELATASGDWPVLIVALRRLPATDGRREGFSVGGGGAR